MERSDKAAFEKMRAWIWRNARPLELAVWRCLFEGGSAEEVLTALGYYQNEDGGFGHALDCDNWNPGSQPYMCSKVIRVLDQIRYKNAAHPMLLKMYDYLTNTPHQNGQGWFFTIPENKDHPHAVWWEYEGARNLTETPGVTGYICGYVLRYLDPAHPFYEKCRVLAAGLLDTLETLSDFGDMGVGAYRYLLGQIEEAGLCAVFADEARWQRLKGRLVGEKEMFEGDCALDENGMRIVPWNWYDNGRFAEEWAISKNWWRTAISIEFLLELRDHGLLDVE